MPHTYRKWDADTAKQCEFMALESAEMASLVTRGGLLRWLDRHLNGVDLGAITRAMLDRIGAAKLAEGVSPATVNRVMEVLRAILRQGAEEWEWIDQAPKVRMLKEPSRRIRFLTHAEAQRLMAHLPRHLADMAALRAGNGPASGERDWLALGRGRSGEQASLGSSR